jgi:hypothetical protein
MQTRGLMMLSSVVWLKTLAGSKRLRVSSVPSKLKINAKVAKKLKERQWCDYLWFASMSDSNLLSI